MSKYKLQDVTLDDIEGRGYAFKRKTAFGEARRGVFFPEDEEAIEALQEREEVTFSGPCYYKKRGPRDREFDINIVNVVPTGMGLRVDFEASDNPEPILQAS